MNAKPEASIPTATSDRDATSGTPVAANLERFDPADGAPGKLIDTEHRGRYWWAARAVAGREVLDAGCGVGYGIEILAAAGAASLTGVDIDRAAVEQAERRFGDRAEAILQGDVRELPLDDDSFDVVVCFETIEHVEDGERALAEFRRVLRPDGLLLVSSPNPGVYPAGNEHHVHEYRPAELAAAVGEHFSHLARFGQHVWLASTIEVAADGDVGANGGPPWSGEVRRTVGLEPDGETYSILLAGDRELPDLGELVSLGEAFEVGWWSEHVSNTQREAHRAVNQSRRAVAQAVGREVTAIERMRESSSALLAANQELARIPLLEHRLAELEHRYTELSRHFSELLGSKSWRLTAPLRRLRRPRGRRSQ